MRDGWRFKKGNPEYDRYIHSAAWRQTADSRLEQDHHICCVCGKPATEVHHLTYEHFRNEQPEPVQQDTTEHKCLCCGVPVRQNPGRKEKKFCSDKCRNKWWNAHLDRVDRRAMREVICANCGKTFSVYGSAARKYCCHECYIEHRFGGGGGGK
ncbi:MAG: hypothetical protein LUF27_03930 [Lachnospiraceae bacterium]|nr:hypothetical protein [Lachnospiraceae bacterium]